MNHFKTVSLVLAIIAIAACSTTQKSTTSTDAISPFIANPATGAIPPGNNELTAIQAKYKDVTLQTLVDGHALYTGVCTKCHSPKSIYRLQEAEWPLILDDMAKKAEITDTQKDAVNKYVLAIKATQPKETK